MRKLLGRIIAQLRDGGSDADLTEKEAVDDDRLVHESFGLTATEVAAVEKRAPS